LVGTFKESSVGFGTIVGSAVFNVLFVIGMCAIFSKDLLVLTWWPLFRDATYYSFSLIMLAVFFQDQVIEIWEAVILLIMYFGYVTVMANNERLYAFFDKLGGGSGAKVNPGEEKTSHGSGTGFKSPFLHPGNFRSGVLSHLLKDKELLDKMSRKIVIHVGNMKGNVQETFNKIDADSSGFIDVKELDQLLKELNIPHKPEDVKIALKEIDSDNDKTISLSEFEAWYGKAETTINKLIADAFDEIDVDNNGFIEKENLEELMKKMGPSVSYNIDEVWKEAIGDNKQEKLDRETFKTWYEKSEMYSEKVEQVTTPGTDTAPGTAGGEQEAADSEPLDVSFPDGTWARITYIILAPLVWGLHLTVPDVRAEGKRNYFGVAFFGSIIWIGIYSFLMVEWATLIGDYCGIPPNVMGLTFLAAGTSIPDLLTSVIVARQGHGDMAVSSSIGSNIFDVLVGLPLPWFIYCCVNSNDNGHKVIVQADTLFLSILILFLMLFAVIFTIKMNKWRMTKGLGMTMFCLYALFVMQDLLRSGGIIPSCFIQDC